MATMTKESLLRKLENLLAWLSLRIIRKYRPDIIAVTGSVGKTGTKDAIFCVLAGSFGVRKSEGNLNNELGLPLSILGERSGGRNPFAWLRILGKAFRFLLQSRPFPELLILEMGADHPGDLERLTQIARPRVSVTTAVAPVHTEFFSSLEALAAEKATLARRTEPDGYTILNADDPVVIGFRDKTDARVLSYGFSPEADLRATSFDVIRSTKEHIPSGLRFILSYEGKHVEVTLHGALGRPAVSAALAGAAVGIVYGLELSAIAEALGHLQMPKGRLRPLRGINQSLLIDDTYNASPRAAIAALDVLGDLAEAPASDRGANSGRRIAVFGNMAELGHLSEAGHQEVGEHAAKICDLLITVGDLAKGIGAGAVKAGFAAKRVASFEDQSSALHLLRQEIGPKDLILIKGSQSARMEKLTAALLENPADAQLHLVRQGPEWTRPH